MAHNLTKQPSEKIVYDAPFGTMPSGAAITSIDSITLLARGKVAEGAALAYSNQQFSGTIVQLTLSSGTDGEEYLITIKVTDSLGEIHEHEVEMRVEDFTWAVPDGSGAIYLSPSEYVTRYGYAETQLLSDTHDVGRIDKDRLGARLLEAAAIVDGYVAKRYQTPLNPVPEAVKGIVADITRFLLHGDNVPEVVADRHKQARASLKDISKGDMVLAVAEATTTATSGTPDFIGPSRTFDRDSLKGF